MAKTAKNDAALILAAGRGRRLGGDVPKQYQPLCGIPVLRHTLEAFLASDAMTLVQAVIHNEDRALYTTAVQGLEDKRLLPPVSGGASRAETTQNGLKALAAHSPCRVLIHDGARPFVRADLIARVCAALDEAPGAFAGIPVVDALWQVAADGQAQLSVPREGLWRAQTPQGFWFSKILAAHETNHADLSDDVAIARAAGLEVRAVLGSEDNFKITVASDLARGERFLSNRA